MTEYWKSQPKKFCEYCKCWISDNKGSIQFHESASRHKQNVEKKLNELQKKGAEQAKINERMGQTMLEVEKAALKALKKDIASDPSLLANYQSDIARLSGLSNVAETTIKSKLLAKAGCSSGDATPTSKDPNAKKKKKNPWQEAKSPEGFTYYWNSETRQTVWEKPKDYDDYEIKPEPAETTVKVKSESSAPKPSPASTSKIKWKTKTEKEEPKPKKQRPELGPANKPEPIIGKWEPMQAATAAPVDLQLPDTPGLVAGRVPVIDIQDEPRMKLADMFKEKTLPPSSGASSAAPSAATKATTFSFNRRKVTTGAQNTRQRNTDA